MKIEFNNKRGCWEVKKGTSRISIYPGQDRLYKPVTFMYDDGPTYISRVGLLSIKKAVKSFYTEEQLFEYFCSITE